MELGVDRVAAAPEVDEGEELEMLFERLGRDVEALADVRGRDHGVRLVAAAVEEIREQRLQEPEALGRDRARRPLLLVGSGFRGLRCDPRGPLRVALLDEIEVRAHLAPQLRRRERHRPPILAQDPGRELPEVRVASDEDTVLDPPVATEQPVHPPRRVAGDLDLRLALRIADLPRRALTIVLGIEAFREPEVSLAACGEPNLAADPRHAERLYPVVVEVEPDDVPLAAVKEQRVRIERALALLVAHDRP